ncbi:MAG: tetratricopeptide repeat protein, partial [Chloroflexia bacterium]|nr:tetratricopeptide repeat protein [Chloroflexia bacterium]
YQQARERYAGTASADQALIYVAQTYLALGRPLSATAVLSPSLGQLDQPMRHQAMFLQGEALRGAGSYLLAVPFYQAYRQGGTELEDLVAERLGWCYRALGLHELAAEEFTRAASAYRPLSDQVWLLAEAADDLRRQGDYAQAAARYERILSLARISWYRASILYRLGETAQEAGQPQQAQAHWQEILASYPDSAAAAWAADALQAAQAPLDAYQAAQAYRAAGRHGEALPWLQQALAEGLVPDDPGRYALADSLAALGDLEGALAELDILRQGEPDDPEPLLEQGRLLGGAGSIARALETYEGVAQQFAGSSAAGEALWRAGQLLEQQEHRGEAAETYRRLLQSQPEHPRAGEARFRAGLLYYQGLRFEEAASLWSGAAGADESRLALWQGLALRKLGRLDEAEAAWQAAAEGQGYYADRARELLAGGLQFGRFQGRPTLEGGGEAEERAREWLSQHWGRPISSTLPQAVLDDPQFQRAQELCQLGLPDEAGQPWSLLIERFRYDGPALYALGSYLRGQHFPAHAARAGDQLGKLLPAGEHPAETWLLRLRYPSAYAHLIVPEAQANGVDPLLLFSLVRRESYFDRYATSWADARGLTQVIPSTGEWIAERLGWAPFRLEDLYRPMVSLPFGAWYLGEQLDTFEGQALPALAAYNGGPGNALRWAEDEVPVGDLDLFVERVDFSETRGYIQGIYQDYWVYRRLYGE